MVTVNSLQAIYKLLCANPDTTTLSKQLNAQLINVRRKSTNCYNLSTFYSAINTVRICLLKELLSSVQNLVSKVNLVCIRVVSLCPVILKTLQSPCQPIVCKPKIHWDQGHMLFSSISVWVFIMTPYFFFGIAILYFGFGSQHSVENCTE